MSSPIQKDLVVLVADKNIEYALTGLLSRNQSLEIRSLTYDIYVHPQKDPGCFSKSDTFLRISIKSHAQALVIFDREGCGRMESREALEEDVERRLSQSGWPDRAAAIVIDPELENWVWSDSPQVDAVLGWESNLPDLRTWLRQQMLLTAEQYKPSRPKEAMEQVLREVRKPRSSALYFELAQCVSFKRCSDPAFLKLKSVLRDWFPTPDPLPPSAD